MKKVFALSIILFCLAPAFSLAAVTAKCTNAGGVTDVDGSAVCYEQLAPITDPGNNNQQVDTSSFPTYLQGMYRIGIGICFVLGVIMFTWAGIEYILSESVTKKSDAKSRISAALIGLAIALVSYILLQTINPDLLIFTDLSTSPAITTPIK